MALSRSIRYIITSIVMFLLVLVITPMTSKASGLNGTDQDINNTVSSLPFAGSTDRTGVMFSIRDKETGGYIGVTMPFYVLADTSAAHKENIENLRTAKTGIAANLQDQYIYTDTAFPKPVIWDNSDQTWSGNSAAIEEYLMADVGGGYKRYEKILMEFSVNNLGKSATEAVAIVNSLRSYGSNMVICIEPVAWNYIYGADEDGQAVPTVNRNGGNWYFGTSYGLIKKNMQLGYDNGSAYNWKWINVALQHCLVLKESIFNSEILAPGGSSGARLSYGDTEGIGYGLATIKIEPKIQHTSASTMSMGAAPSETTGTTTIVKTYITHNEYDDSYVVDGNFSTSRVSPLIKISNEGDYKVTRWKSTNTVNTSPGFSEATVDWTGIGTAIQSGSGAPTDTIVADKCLYVMYMKTISQEPQNFNYKISQSSISRRVWIANPDNELSMTDLNSYRFTYPFPAHITECTGHTELIPAWDPITGIQIPSTAQTIYCTGWTWIDQLINMGIQQTSNLSSYNKIVSDNASYNRLVNAYSGFFPFTGKVDERNNKQRRLYFFCL